MANGGVPNQTAAWHKAFPEPLCTDPKTITADELLARFNEGQRSGVDFLLVDLRRIDFEGGTISGSLNLPAQSLYHSLSTVYDLCKCAGIEDVIWYCGSSRGRGTRAAGWFDDLIKRKGNTKMRSMTLKGGVKNWATSGVEYVQLMSGYTSQSEEYWNGFDKTC